MLFAQETNVGFINPSFYNLIQCVQQSITLQNQSKLYLLKTVLSVWVLQGSFYLREFNIM